MQERIRLLRILLLQINIQLTGVMIKTMHNRISANLVATGVSSWLSDACACFGSNPKPSVITELRQDGKLTDLYLGYERLSQHD